MFQIEVWKSQEYFVYFKIFKPISWDKRPAERRSRLIQRFLKFLSGIKRQAGANKSVCSCFLPPEGVPAQPPCSAAFQRSCVLHRAFSYGPSARSADRIPARTKKYPSRTRREKAAARRAANEILRRAFGASVFGLFAAYPMARVANAEKMCYNLS